MFIRLFFIVNFNLLLLQKSVSYMEIELQRTEQIGGDRDNFMDWSNYQVKKFNRTVRQLVGNMTYHVPVDNSYQLEGVIFAKQGGEYRRLPYRVPLNGYCDFMKDEPGYFYEELAAVSNLPYPFECPSPEVSNI